MGSVSPNKADRKRIGIIAGRGELPVNLAQSLKARGENPYILLVKGEAREEDFADFPHESIVITKVGKFLKALNREGCGVVTLAGPVNRPDFRNLIPDMEGLRLLKRIGGALSKGDDGLMRAITGYLADKGFQIIGAHELSGSLVAEPGLIGSIEPEAEDWQDIHEGLQIVKAVGALDIGQAAVIRRKYVLAVEAAEGTEALIRRCGDFAWDYPAGVLVKLSKPGQELRADMPTIGPDTVEQIQAANLKGIAVEAGKTLIVNRERIRELADRAGIFVVAVTADQNLDQTQTLTQTPKGTDPS
ncbi:LpxI family protein [Sneathiella chinensis]|uniref:UDP-2,3-diacylglucosamine pyrophosphatase n=1 Tax=Sneathiella chinensis TaxID=349750 RepID=A0ABQ5U7G0_9PROT|nr:hypothetical protein GCM10007924_24300 [Sneathiella chinensis]